MCALHTGKSSLESAADYRAGSRYDFHSIRLTEVQKREFKPVAIELKKGYASFHHPLMVHGSFENTTGIPRRAAVLNVFRDGVVSDSDLPPLDGVPAVPKGKPMQGQFFPLLFVPSSTKGAQCNNLGQRPR